MTRKEFKAYREKLFQRHKKCYYCEEALTKENVTLDHKTPISRGGTDDKNNLVLCCSTCNNIKDNKTEREFRRWMSSSKDERSL